MSTSTDPSPPIDAIPTKKRKLRRPRTSHACVFCRKRKVKCSGTYPCEYCVKEDAQCEYDTGLPVQNGGPTELITAKPIDGPILHEKSSAIQSKSPIPYSSRRTSLDPPQTFIEGQHVGPTSGVSFLYHHWKANDRPGEPSERASEDGDHVVSSASLISYGDFKDVALDASTSDRSLPATIEMGELIEHYFRFATPTYRLLHRPTLEKWAATSLNDTTSLLKAQHACVLIVFAQSLLYTNAGDRYVVGGVGDEGMQLSRFYCERAKSLLNHETGPASLSSVQARLLMCLYLLSTMKMNECRFTFSFAITILTSLGLQRKQSSNKKLSLIEQESRKRTFWCAYVLDGYLSVMLGRPRLLRDEDIDQLQPRNFDDQDLLSSELAEELPLHGNLEAFIAHADLAKLMAKTSDLLYPLKSLTEDQVLGISMELLDHLELWRSNLPDFLKPRPKTLTGHRTFERQNTVLKLAYAHLCILATRRCLLADFATFGCPTLPQHDDERMRPIRVCITGITTIIDATHDLTRHGSLYQAFWFTQYIALVAISTLYVFLIQSARQALPIQSKILIDIDIYFAKAKECQTHLAAIAPSGSQAKRHQLLLDQLRNRVERDLLKARRQPIASSSNIYPCLTNSTSSTQCKTKHHDTRPQISKPSSGSHISISQLPLSLANSAPQTSYVDPQPNISAPNTSIFGEAGMLDQFTPSAEDVAFQNMLDLGWENLDTLGFVTASDMYEF